MGINKAIIVGRLGGEPELKTLSSGSPVCNFNVATSESWTDSNGQKQERTEWHKVVVFSGLAELCSQYLQKGSLVYLEGKLKTRKWEDKNKIERYTTEIHATSVQFLDKKNNAADGQEDLPF